MRHTAPLCWTVHVFIHPTTPAGPPNGQRLQRFYFADQLQHTINVRGVGQNTIMAFRGGYKFKASAPKCTMNRPPPLITTGVLP